MAGVEPARETDAARKKREAAQKERDAADRKREAVKLEAQLREARTAEREAQAALAKARRLLAAAEQEKERLTKQLEAAGDAILSFNRDVSRRQRESDQASIARARLEEQLSQFRCSPRAASLQTAGDRQR